MGIRVYAVKRRLPVALGQGVRLHALPEPGPRAVQPEIFDKPLGVDPWAM